MNMEGEAEEGAVPARKERGRRRDKLGGEFFA